MNKKANVEKLSYVSYRFNCRKYETKTGICLLMQLSFYCEASNMMILGYVFLQLKYLAEFILR